LPLYELPLYELPFAEFTWYQFFIVTVLKQVIMVACICSMLVCLEKGQVFCLHNNPTKSQIQLIWYWSESKKMCQKWSHDGILIRIWIKMCVGFYWPIQIEVYHSKKEISRGISTFSTLVLVSTKCSVK
jgi:hypothetical protein